MIKNWKKLIGFAMFVILLYACERNDKSTEAYLSNGVWYTENKEAGWREEVSFSSYGTYNAETFGDLLSTIAIDYYSSPVVLKINGDYELNNDAITFVSSNLDATSVFSGSNDFASIAGAPIGTYYGLNSSNDGYLGEFYDYNYQTSTWNIIEISDSYLRVEINNLIVNYSKK